MKIDILCGPGSSDGVHLSDIFGVNGRIGVGGSEIALLTLCEGWTKAGHEVILYNNPRRNDGVFEQRMTDSFDKNEKRDVLIVFRSPTPKIVGVKSLKVFFSCDQYTIGDFTHFTQFVEKVVTISPHHTKFLALKYGIRNAVHIDLPVRSWEYDKEVEKVPNRLIFTSVPDRGLQFVATTFPKIQAVIPDVSLVITSDYRLWGTISPLNQQYIQMFLSQRGVQFLGAVTRDRLIQEQLQAQIHYYPCVYEELFAIAVAESQVAGVLPITTPIGALETTNMGVIIDGNAKDQITQQVFVDTTIRYLQDPNLPSIQKDLRKKAKERFSLEKVLQEWDEKVFR